MDIYAKFDRHIARYDSDSLDWCDGLGADDAVALLNDFKAEDWQALNASYAGKNRLWRGCLASALNPYMGTAAQDLLLALLEDPDSEVAFLALRATAFYCGINANADGPFIDPTIVHAGFLQHVRSTHDIIGKIRMVSANCSANFAAQFRLLEEAVS